MYARDSGNGMIVSAKLVQSPRKVCRDGERECWNVLCGRQHGGDAGAGEQAGVSRIARQAPKSKPGDC